MRARCKNDCWNDGLKDPELTKNKFYEVIDPNIQVMNADSHLSIIGDSGEEITRPKHVFQLFKS